MSETRTGNGRLGNQIIRNKALSIIAEKHDLFVNYSNFENINNKLGIKLFIGNNKYNHTKIIKNNDYKKLLKYENIDFNLDFMKDYFQEKEIIDIIYNNINLQKQNIIDLNPFKKRYNQNNDLFVHVRLGDIAKKNWNMDLNYYLDTIKKINFDNIILSSDSLNHEIIKNIQSKYPNIKLDNHNEIECIQFASTCKNIILSHGSYSAIIGYLSFFSNIYYPDIKPIWCPIDLCKISSWIPQKIEENNNIEKKTI